MAGFMYKMIPASCRSYWSTLGSDKLDKFSYNKSTWTLILSMQWIMVTWETHAQVRGFRKPVLEGLRGWGVVCFGPELPWSQGDLLCPRFVCCQVYRGKTTIGSHLVENLHTGNSLDRKSPVDVAQCKIVLSLVQKQRGCHSIALNHHGKLNILGEAQSIYIKINKISWLTELITYQLYIDSAVQL